jgi:hypothetical protein
MYPRLRCAAGLTSLPIIFPAALTQAKAEAIGAILSVM